jgi:hypothetical protein
MKNVSLIIIFCFVNFFCFASNTNDDIKFPDSLNIIVNEMAHSGVYELGLVGIAGSPSQQDTRLQKIKKMASVSELFALTENASPIVRLYSFIALLDRHENIPSETLKNLENDKAIVVSITGCIASEKSVGSIVREIITKRNLNKI